MTRLGSSAVLLAMGIAGGCAATAADRVGASEDSVHLDVPPDASMDAASDSASDDSDAADAAAPAAPPPGPSTTTFAEKLTAIGLDVNNLPALHDLPMAQKLKVDPPQVRELPSRAAA